MARLGLATPEVPGFRTPKAAVYFGVRVPLKGTIRVPYISILS